MSDGDYWVFGYGSLIWDPGFPYLEKRTGILRGYHRRFCLYSHRYRGTKEKPGLVLGLDRGGACSGVVFRVAASDVPTVKEYLWDREMLNSAYVAKMLRIKTPSGPVMAQSFVINPENEQYAGRLTPDATARLIATSCGERGQNCTYLFNTVDHLAELGIHDRGLEALAIVVRRLIALHGEGLDRPDHPVFAGDGI